MANNDTLRDGDTFDVDGYTFTVKYEHDDAHGAPWDEEDGHGPVSEWTTRAKRPGEWLLHKDGRHCRYYDAQAAMRTARGEGWGAAFCRVCGEESGGLGTSMYDHVHKYGPKGSHHYTPATRRQRAAVAVRANFKYLQAWCKDEWRYVAVVVTLINDGKLAGPSAALGGCNDDDLSFLSSTARELAAEIIAGLPRDASCTCCKGTGRVPATISA